MNLLFLSHVTITADTFLLFLMVCFPFLYALVYLVTCQNVFEGLSEIDITHCVQHWIDGAVCIAQPVGLKRHKG